MNLFSIIRTIINMPIAQPFILALVFSLASIIPLFIIDEITDHIKTKKNRGRTIDVQAKLRLAQIQDDRDIRALNARERQRIPTNFKIYEFFRSLFI